MTQEQSILKEMPYLYLMSLWIWRNVTKYIYTWSKKWKYFWKIAGIAYVAAAAIGWMLLH